MITVVAHLSLVMVVGARPILLRPQQQHVITGDALCAACRVIHTIVATLDSETSAISGEPVALAQVSDRLFMIDRRDRASILMFAKDGRFLGTIGRRGHGPNEFANLSNFAASGDTLYAFDNGNARIVLLSSSGAFLSERPLQTTIVHGGIATDKGMVLNSTILTFERIGLPLHLIDEQGVITRSFGSPRPVLRPDKPGEQLRALARSADGGIWSAHRTSYVIDHVESAGEHTSFRRDPPWFPPDVPRPIGTGKSPPPWIMGIAQEARGRLVVLVNVPDPNYTAILGPRRQSTFGLHYDVSRREELYDTVVEVLDTDRRRLIVTDRLPFYLVGFLAPELVWGYRLTKDGEPQVYTMHLQLPG